ncbi:hypothetical protein B6178_01400 [Staphylococcus aureus]|nr:hypothetical protein B6178_01400 [Staphylococcus aureus]
MNTQTLTLYLVSGIIFLKILTSRDWNRNDIFAKFIPVLPQLALPVEFLFEILCVGGPPL